MKNIIYKSEEICKCFRELKFGLLLSDVHLNHLKTIATSVFMQGYNRKIVDFERYSTNHRTTIAHFLNKGKWNDNGIEKILKSKVIDIIYNESKRTGEPIFCIVDDTIASHTKPSSQALHPIDKEIAEELPEAPNISYLLCDSWYTTQKVCESFIKKGYYTIGALKTNRIIYPLEIKTSVREFAELFDKSDSDINLVTVAGRKFYVKRYEGRLNGIENAVVLMSYPEEAFLNPKALRVFISTNVELTTQEILDFYVKRWKIEVFFRQSKNILAFDKYQIRSKTGICRYWLILSLVHFLCCTFDSQNHSFEYGFKNFQHIIYNEYISYIYYGAKNGISLETFLQRGA